MDHKSADNPTNRSQTRGEMWQPLAKRGQNEGIFYENWAIFRRKYMMHKDLTKTQINGEFIPNSSNDLRRKTTGALRGCFHNSLPNYTLGKAHEIDFQKYSQTKYNNSCLARFLIGMALIASLIGCGASERSVVAPTTPVQLDAAMTGSRAGEERAVVGVKLCWCPAGTYMRGSPPDEPERRPGEDQVEVTLGRGFWAGKFEVTQGEWQRVVGTFNGNYTAGEGENFPIYDITFAEAEDFCRKLTALAQTAGEIPMGWEFRLPTDAQWEYFCRAGTTTATHFGNSLSSKQANFEGKPYNGAEAGPSLKRTAPVGSYPANPWGLHDVHGNVFEWCRDWAHAKYPGGADPDLYLALDTAEKNRTGDCSRVRRGGCYADDGYACRSAMRVRFEPHRHHDHIGMRVVLVKP